MDKWVKFVVKKASCVLIKEKFQRQYLHLHSSNRDLGIFSEAITPCGFS